MRSGARDRRVNIRAYSTWTRSTDGEPLKTWTTSLTDIWAQKIPLAAREMFRQDTRWENVEARYIVPYTTAINVKNRLYDHYDGKEYEIESVIDIGSRRRELELIATKVG